MDMARESDNGAFLDKFLLQPTPSTHQLPLNALTFAVKDIFDVEGYVTGFGNPDWAKDSSGCHIDSPSCFGCLKGSINGENKHYGTPRNPCVPDRVPGGSSSGSAVAVGAKLVDFALGTDTGGSVRVPASYCGILGFRPSHGAISTAGVIPMAQSFDSVGDLVKHAILGDYVKEKVPSLKQFMTKGNGDQEYNIPSLAALSSAMRVASKHRYEFKNNHGEWVRTVKPDLGPGISERVWEAVKTTDENVDVCHSVKTELRAALNALLGDFGVLAIPTVPGPPPELQSDPTPLEAFRAKAFSLLSIAGVSGFCQVSIPLGLYDNLPVAISLLAKHGSDGFLLNLVEIIYDTLQEEVGITEKRDY
uniref:Amidase domain-containing protein n=1 Tax=Fagus sylvatica TaxID=28930 RepID=A0A2N9GJ97_FAGSY